MGEQWPVLFVCVYLNAYVNIDEMCKQLKEGSIIGDRLNAGLTTFSLISAGIMLTRKKICQFKQLTKEKFRETGKTETKETNRG